MSLFDHPYRSSEEESPSFIGKAAGVAKLGAIVGLGISAARGSLRFTGTQFIKLGESSLQSLSESKLGSVISGLTKNFFAETGAHSPISQILSGEVNFLSQGLDKVEQTIVSNDLSTKRINSFVEGLVSHEVFSKEAAEEHKELLRTTFERVGGAANASEALDTIFTDSGLNHINKKLSPLKVGEFFNSQAQQREVFTQILSKSADQKASHAVVEEVMGNEASRKSVTDFLLTGVKKSKSQSNNIKKMFNITSHDFENIKLSEISKGHANFNQTKHDLVEEYLHSLESFSLFNTEVKKDGTAIESKVDKLVWNLNNKVNKLYGTDIKHPEAQQIKHALEDLETGLVIAKKNNKVTSIPRALNVASRATDRIITHLQLPLIPYFRNIPLSNLTSFAKTSRTLVHDLGFLNSSPELKRMFSNINLDNRIISSTSGVLNVSSDGKLVFHKANLAQFDLSTNSYYKKLHDVRNTEVNHDALANLKDFRLNNLTHSDVHELLYANQHRMSKVVGWDKDKGFLLEANNFLNATALKAIHPNLAQKDPTKLHPIQLAEYLIKAGQVGNLAEISPTELESAFRHLSREASRSEMDLTGDLKSMWEKLGRPAKSAVQHELWLRGDTPQGVRTAFTSVPFEPTQNFEHALSDPQTLSEYRRRTSDKMYRTAQHVNSNLHDLDRKGNVETQSLIGDVVQGLEGADGPGRTTSRLQEGMLDELTHIVGGQKLYNLLGKGAGTPDYKTMQQELVNVAMNGHDSAFNHPILDALEKKGLNRAESVGLIQEHFTGQLDHTEYNKVDKIGTLLLDHSDISNLTDNSRIQAKMINNLYDNLTTFAGLSAEKRSQMSFELLHEGEIHNTLSQRFRAGRGFHPQAERLNPSTTQRTYVTNSVVPNVAEWVNDPIGSSQAIMKSIFGTVSGLFNPDMPLNNISASIQSMLQRPNNIGEKIGLGLNAQDRITTFRSMSSFMIKRAAPLLIGYEAYKNFNSNMHTLGLPGADDFSANLLANLRLEVAGSLDTLGLTEPLKNAINAIPGAGDYISVKSEKEERDYLYYGNEAVRAHRGNFYLSKDPIMGGRIEGYRPNFYRRWKSHWTEDADLNSAGHSFLPNIENPLGALNPTNYTGWFAKKHQYDRPYEGFSKGWAQMGSGSDSGGGIGVGQGSGNGTGTSGSGTDYSLNAFKYADQSAPEISNLANFVSSKVQNLRSEMGLFGSILSGVPGLNFETDTARSQTARDARGASRMLYMDNYMGFLGGYGEYFRRFIHRSPSNSDDYSPLINNMPTWLGPKFAMGDPYLKTFAGELNLPGKAFMGTHPWDQPLRVRGSTVGLSVQEIIEKWLDPVGEEMDEAGENITGFGSEVHERIQHQLRDQGYLIGAEVAVFDPEHNISGTIDAILKGPNGKEIIDIKTQGANHWGETPDKYIDQINTYMAITGIKSAKLAFVNRDNMSQVRIESFAFSEERWQKTIEKIDYARGLIHQMEQKNLISPFETYDLVSRIEILSKVAPESEAFRKHVDAAVRAGGFGGFEKQRFDQALHEAHELRKQYKTNNYAYNLDLEDHELKVQDILSDGTIVTKFGTLKLAGVKFDKQSFDQISPEKALATFGISKGASVNFQFAPGTFNEYTAQGRTTEVIAGAANKSLAHSVFGNPDYDSDSPLAKRALHGNSLVLGGVEKFLHSDNLFINKIFRHRSALEQFERGEVFGSDQFNIHHPFTTGFIPLVTSLVNKNPVAAGIVSSLATGMFFSERNMRGRAMKIAGLVGAGVSAITRLYSKLTDKTLVSKKYKKSMQFDEYWDAIKYIKSEAMAQEAKRLSADKENFDIDQAVEDGRPLQAGQYTKLYLQAKQKTAQTMYGYDVAKGTLEQAIAAIPHRHRQLAEEVVLYGSMKDKQKFYNDLGEDERRVLGKFLGAKPSNPEPQELKNIFKKHAMPDVAWAGWDPLINEDDLEIRSRSVEGIGVNLPNRNKVASARARTSEVSIPNFSCPTFHNIDRTLQELMRSYSGLSHAISVAPSKESAISVKYDLKYDATNELMREIYRN